MIWLDNTSDVHPAGSEVASNVAIGGSTYNLWYSGTAPGGTVSYQFASPRTSVSGLDLGPLTSDAVSRGYIGSTSWWLQYVDAGFEIWQLGAGLAVNSFSVCDPAGC
jgi:Glycosyl hydrolase family 12